jgi:nucleoside-diphosphate-sugar epimerase
MAKILITGHKGFVGTHLAKKIRQPFTGVDLKDGNDILACDLPDADVVIHLAAKAGVVRSMEDPLETAETNILGTLRLLTHYKDAKFIFASSGGTIQEEIESAYGLSKFTAEEYIKLLHPNHVILRFPNVYGPGSRSVVDKWLNEDVNIIYGDGNTYRIYAHVDDVVRAILLSLKWPPGTYSLGSHQRYSVMELAQAIDKSVVFEAARPGEITHSYSVLHNTTPDWEAKINLMEYIDGIRHNSEQK